MKTSLLALPKLLERLFGFCLFFQLATGLSAAAVENQPKPLQLQVAERAALFLPRSLRDLIHRHQESFENGMNSLSMDPFLSPLGRTRLEDRLLEKLKLTIQSLDSKPRFGEVTNNLGGIAIMVLYLNLPEGADLTKQDFQLILDYGAQNTNNFPLVVYDQWDENAGPDVWLDLIKVIRVRRAGFSLRFLMVHPQIRSEKSEDGVSFRSPLFGISSLLFSHSVNDLAKIWCLVWKVANGDMAGMPAIP